MNSQTINAFKRAWEGNGHGRLGDAIERTYERFAGINPDWAASLFDQFFIRDQGRAAIERHVRGQTQFGSVELAEAWAGQLGWFDERTRQRRTAEVIPVASDFLRILDQELVPGPPARERSSMITLAILAVAAVFIGLVL